MTIDAGATRPSATGSDWKRNNRNRPQRPSWCRCRGSHAALRGSPERHAALPGRLPRNLPATGIMQPDGQRCPLYVTQTLTSVTVTITRITSESTRCRLNCDWSVVNIIKSNKLQQFRNICRMSDNRPIKTVLCSRVKGKKELDWQPRCPCALGWDCLQPQRWTACCPPRRLK